jgi:serine/threonine protein kinase
MVLAQGSLLVERFAIDRLAGEGGMGRVYRAADLLTGRWVAVKQLQGQGSADDAARLLREAQLLAALRHPGIVSYIDHGLAPDGAPYLVTEWLDGQDLESRLLTAPLSIPDTLRVLEQSAEALAQAHRLGIIHRDLFAPSESSAAAIQQNPAATDTRWIPSDG